MKTLLPLAVLLAAPAAAQDGVYYASDTWPVHAAGGRCTMTQAAHEDRNDLSVSYDGREVVLATINEVKTPLPDSGSVAMRLVFLENAGVDYDDGWSSRPFAYTREGDLFRFSSRFAGEKNTRQLLDDLANSKHLGFLIKDDVFYDYDLRAAAPSIARLRECAARTVAAN
jgi:hypothetical protein